MSAALNSVPGMHRDKTMARALALAMHAAFFVLLIFGVSWQKKPELPVVADLWSSLPPMAEPKVDVTPEPQPEPPPKPVPRVEPPPVPKAAPAPVPKPDITLKKKIEKEKKVEPKVEPKPAPKKREDDKAAADKAAAKARQDAEAKKKRDDEDLKKFREEKDATAKAEAQKSEQGKIISEYMERIRAKVRQNIVEPPGMQGNPTAEFDVVLIPGGEVLSVRLVRSSGVPAYDAAAERAIMKSAPLPLPPNPELFSRFRDLHLSVRPKQ